MQESLVPVAEHFHSIQGEGTHVGVPMHFIRLAGCSVGAKSTLTHLTRKNETREQLPVLQSGAKASYCRTYDGRFFTCDTDFNLHSRLTVDSLFEQTYEKHICLTGGEPLNHLETSYFDELFRQAEQRGIQIHVETSGTVYDKTWFDAGTHWITVAPKYNFDERAVSHADEVKILVDKDFKIEDVPPVVYAHRNVFLCPINDEMRVSQTNVKLCMTLLIGHPTWRLSCQWHKFLGLR